MRVLITIVAVLFFGSCNPRRMHELTNVEKRFIDSLALVQNAAVRVEKAYAVEYGNANNETVYLILNYNNSKINFCLDDSVRLCLRAQEIARRFTQVMDKSPRYKNIAVNFYSSDLSVPRMETPTCDRTFVYDAKSNQFAEYFETNKNLRVSKSKAKTAF